MDDWSRYGDVFSVFFRTTPDYCSISTLEDGVVMEVNEAFVRITGWPREEVIGRSVFDFGLWHDPAERQALVERIRREGHIHVDRITLRTRAGVLIDCEASMFTIPFDPCEGLVTIIRDVSVQRRAEGALERLARGAGMNTRTLFDTLVVDLAQSLDADYCLIGMLPDENSAELEKIAIYGSEMRKPYLFRNGPGVDVLRAPVVVIPDGVSARYPDDRFVAKKRVVAFAGAPLRDRQQQVIGMMLVMSTRPFASPETVGPLLQVFADRVSAELVMERERLGFVGVQARLMAEIEATRDRFQAQAKKLQSILDACPLTMGVVLDRKWTVLNRAFERMFGYAIGELIGQSAEVLYPSREEFISIGERIQAAIANGGVSHFEVQYRRKNGEIFWANNYARLIDENAPEKGAIVILEDISERKASEERIRFLAEHDQLTGLPNRFVLRDRFEQERRHADRNARKLALLFLDLDRFKEINDTFGHAAGDRMIIGLAQRVSKVLRQSDRMSRLSGDEFAILQTDVHGPRDCELLASRILKAMSEPFDLGDGEVIAGVSIGIALAPQNSRDGYELMHLADLALYRAKNEGRNRFCFFQTRMGQELRLRRSIEDDLRAAIASDALTLHFQPVFETATGKVVSVEALVRWPHPTQGLLYPDDFLSIAEDRGLSLPLNEWVLRQACLRARDWSDLRLAVNISPIQFRHGEFLGAVRRILDVTGFDPTRLEVEITEAVVLANAAQAETTILDLRAMGVRVTLDDFGCGYSSLLYLRRFAFDKIKIDRSFLEAMEATGESAILVHSIVHLGRALGLEVVAEGVETEAQARYLRGRGVVMAQGYLFAPALKAAAFRELADALGGGAELAATDLAEAAAAMATRAAA